MVGTLARILIEFHAKVPITTMNITPTSAASGISSITDDPTRMKSSRQTAAATPAIRVRPPEFTLIIDCPIMAQPPMPPKKPVTTLAVPWAMHSCEAPPRWPVISPTRFSVSRLSIRPMAARIIA